MNVWVLIGVVAGILGLAAAVYLATECSRERRLARNVSEEAVEPDAVEVMLTKQLAGALNLKPDDFAAFVGFWRHWFQRISPLGGGSFSYFCDIPQLEDRHVASCQIMASRVAMLEQLPKRAVCGEIGTFKGEFAAQIAARCNPLELHLFDLNFDQLEVKLERAVRHEGDSATELEKLPDGFFDWLYIDADHTYTGVKRDIAVATHKIKADGLLAFNDYTNWSFAELMPYGVRRAVNELCVAEGWELAFYCLDPWNYCDVAIRRIA
jgi:hypothetical protein